jgi:hypothetical protein
LRPQAPGVQVVVCTLNPDSRWRIRAARQVNRNSATGPGSGRPGTCAVATGQVARRGGGMKAPPKRGVPPVGRRREVPIAGPTPDHAQAYFPPKTVPPATDHRTIEIATVRLAPEIDPRCMATQRSLPRMRPRTDRGSLSSGRPSVRPVTLPSGGPRRGGVAALPRPVWALLGVGVALAVAILVRLVVERVHSAPLDRAGQLPVPVRNHTASQAGELRPLPAAAAERKPAGGASAAVKPHRIASAPPAALPRELLAPRSAPTGAFQGESAAKQSAAIGPAPPGVTTASVRPEPSPAVSSAGSSPPNRDAPGLPGGSAQEPKRASGHAEPPTDTESAEESAVPPPAPRSRRPSFF